MITVSQFEDRFTQDIIDLVLHFQNDGTRPIVSVDDQPDLLDIRSDFENCSFLFDIREKIVF